MKTKHFISGLLLFAAGVAAAQPEQWLKYHVSPDQRNPRWLTLTTNPPPNVTLPRFSSQPWFARWTTPMDPSGGRWICFDRSRKSGPYDRVYFDSDGSGRLNGPPGISAQINQNAAQFSPLRFVFKGDDGSITYHLNLTFYALDGNDNRLLASSGCWYDGTIDIGGKKRVVQLIDGNVNGTFNDLWTDGSEYDRISVGGESVGEHGLGRLLEVDHQFYRIEVARDGAYLKLQKAENVALGTVRVPETITELTAIGENGEFHRTPAHGEFTLPEGNYRIQQWKISRKDQKGSPWEMTGYSFDKPGNFTVAADKPVALQVGEPVRASLDFTESRGETTFNLHFAGPLNESIQILQEGQRPRGPRLTLTSLNGSYGYTNYFEFG